MKATIEMTPELSAAIQKGIDNIMSQVKVACDRMSEFLKTAEGKAILEKLDNGDPLLPPGWHAKRAEPERTKPSAHGSGEVRLVRLLKSIKTDVAYIITVENPEIQRRLLSRIIDDIQDAGL